MSTIGKTASSAEVVWSKNWSTFRDQLVRLDEQLKSERRLVASGQVSQSDELASFINCSRKTNCHLVLMRIWLYILIRLREV